jgi:hypothetical protein
MRYVLLQEFTRRVDCETSQAGAWKVDGWMFVNKNDGATLSNCEEHKPQNIFSASDSNNLSLKVNE